MEKIFKVPAIGCEGCTRTIENELGDLDGVLQVSTDVDTKMVTVQFDKAETWAKILETLSAIEYPPQDV